MRMAAPQKSNPVRSEQIILFRAGNQIFAISSASVQEVRSVDSLAGAAVQISEASLSKVRHAIRRAGRNLYVVNAPLHFGLRATPAALVFLLRNSRIALLVDGIEKMTTMTRLLALPGAFCNEERVWYRGLTVLDQNVVPVVNPAGFLSAEEISLLDAVTAQQNLVDSNAAARPEVNA
ncbi:MAG: chemotaxis protein CheW [Candidatus Acidiferrum sp.]|jgi:chemotaxis signal transduction protein